MNRSNYDEIDWAPDEYIDIRIPPYKVKTEWFERDRKSYGQNSIDGLWFDAYTWRLFRQTKLTTTPMLDMKDVKPFKIDGSIGKFKFCI